MGGARPQVIKPNPKFAGYAQILAFQPPDMRPTAVANLKKSLTDSFLQTGKMIGPDGRTYRAKSPDQAGKLVDGWIKDSFNQYAQKFPDKVRTTPLPTGPAPSWNDRHWILHGLGMATEAPLHMSLEDWGRTVGRALDPLAKGLSAGTVDLRHGQLHRPNIGVAKLLGSAVGLPSSVIDRIYASTPEATKSLWDTARGNSMYGKDYDLAIDLSGLKKKTGPISKLLPDQINVQKAFDTLGEQTGEYVLGEGIGGGVKKLLGLAPKLVEGAQGSKALAPLAKYLTREIGGKQSKLLGKVLTKAVTAGLGSAVKVGEDGPDKNAVVDVLKAMGKDAVKEVIPALPKILRQKGVVSNKPGWIASKAEKLLESSDRPTWQQSGRQALIEALKRQREDEAKARRTQP